MNSITIDERLFEALRSGQSLIATEILAAHPELATTRFDPIDQSLSVTSFVCHPEQYGNARIGQSPLHLAAWNGEQRLVKQLLELGADPNARDRQGGTPLHAMVRWVTRPDIVGMVLERGADINAVDYAGQTPLHLAASCIRRPGHQWGNHTDLCNFLLAHGAIADIFAAVMLNLTDQAAMLLKQNPELVHARTTGNQTHPESATPLHIAVDRGKQAMAEMLLDYGADPNSLDARGRPALYLAAHIAGTRKLEPTPELVDLLLQHSTATPIFNASLIGQCAELRELLIHDPAQIQALDQAGYTALHLAAWNGQVAAVAELLAHDADIAARTKRNETALQLAITYGHHATAELLLNHGATPDIFSAVILGRIDLLEQLLDHQSELASTTNRYGRTPLRLAIEREQTAVIDYLIGREVKPYLWMAAGMCDFARVEALVETDRHALHQRDQWGYTALHWASKSGQLAVIEYLLEQGAGLEPRGSDGGTPLTLALWHEQSAAARLLVASGADIDALDNWGGSPRNQVATL